LTNNNQKHQIEIGEIRNGKSDFQFEWRLKVGGNCSQNGLETEPFQFDEILIEETTACNTIYQTGVNPINQKFLYK